MRVSSNGHIDRRKMAETKDETLFAAVVVSCLFFPHWFFEYALSQEWVMFSFRYINVFFTMIFIKLSSLIICPTRDNYTIEWDFYRTHYFLGTNDINFKIKRLLVEFVDNDIKKTLFMKNAEKTMNYWNN